MQSPPWFSVATHFKGTTEVHGAMNNPQIVEMFRVSGHPEVKDDETPWCAAFVGTCLRLSGFQSSGSLGARSYQNFGQDLKNAPTRGCIVVFWRGDPKAETGHVAFYDHDDGDRVFVLGGNQNDAVNVTAFPKNRVLSYRLPTETAPLPTDTTLPNILSIDPDNAPPHLRGTGAAISDATRDARATDILADGATGPRVRDLQQALSTRGFQLGEIDGEFGPRTASAVSTFQSTNGLPVTGIADADTQRLLGLVVAEPAPPIAPTIPTILPLPSVIAAGGANMQPQDILKAVFEVLTANQQPPAAPAPAAKGVDTSQLLQIVLAALSGKASDSTVPTTPPVMSPIDKLLGGEALQGKKTPLAILAYAILAIMQTLDPANGPTGTTGSVLTTLIASFGGLGVLAKVDRVVQMLGIIAAKPPAASK